jgi:antitoxin component of MazEF toxin-antitoxin module
MIKLKVRKFGNSLGVVLPKTVIARLQTGKGERICLIETGECDYSLTSRDPPREMKMAKAKEIINRHRKTLDALAR